MKLKDLIAFLESVAPPELQESYDNSGLLVGDRNMEVHKVLVCLDSTPEIVEEARSGGYNVIVAHHPIIFGGLKSITGHTYIERAVMKAIKADIAIYAIHTNLDNVLASGVNGKIAERLQITKAVPLSPLEVPDQGGGAIGKLPEPMNENDFLAHLKDALQVEVIRHTKLLGRPIEKVAVCGGSGSFLLPEAVAQGAQCFVSSDFKYHQFFDANDRLVIFDVGHFEGEQFTINLLCELITQKFPKFAPDSAKTNTNPINYYF